MNTYVVLIRGINVGGRNLVPMRELVKVLEKRDYQNIRTYIQSGNLVLQNRKKPEDISSIIQDRFGFKPEVLVLEKAEFTSAVEHNPYRSPEGKTIHFYFCREDPEINLERLEKLKSQTEEFHIDGRVFYLWAPEGIGRSKLANDIESCLGVSATGRNLNTINKLMEMMLEL